MIEYEFDFEVLKEHNITLHRVVYSNFINPENKIMWHDEIISSLYKKSKVWEYENEWRLITTKDNLYRNNKLKQGFSIKSITFGLNTSKKDIDLIMNLLPECKFYIMTQEDKYRKPFSIIKKEFHHSYCIFDDTNDFYKNIEPESLKEYLESLDKRKIKHD